ncbi:MAG: hypothetical protein DRJ03_00805 [Chloroflexi bacterium]|nr:MAG: hypothetical protein DRJ03_00805 [Chloroflexota bacterium]
MAPEDVDPRRKANQIVMDLCFRVERMCRYSPLDGKEVCEQSMKDRNIVFDLYYFYRSRGDDQETAARNARANAIRLILDEVFA